MAAGGVRGGALLCAAALWRAAIAHDHHGGESHIPEGETVSQEPLVSLFWIRRMALRL